MRFSNSIIAGLAATTLLFSACSGPNTLGTQVQPAGDRANVYFTDTMQIVASTYYERSVAASQNTLNLVGYYNDPIFGPTSASCYLQFQLPATSIGFQNATSVDSVVLCLAYPTKSIAQSQLLYGDSTKPQIINVYQIGTDIRFSKDSSIKSNVVINYEPGNLVFPGKNSFVPHPASYCSADSVLIGSVKLAPHIRVNLTKEFGNKLLQADPSVYATNAAFNTFFNGLYITADTNSVGGNILYFNALNGQTKLTLYYTPPGGTTQLTTDFIVTSSSARINHFTHNYSTSQIASVFKDSVAGANSLYVQSMAGTKAKIKFPYLRNLSKLGKVTINKAELVINAALLDTTIYKLPPTIYVVGNDGYQQDVIILDQSESSSYYGGSVKAAQYKLNISRHLQKLVNDPTIVDNGLFIIVGSSAVSANRVVLGGPKNPIYKMKLNLTYTKP